MKPLISVVIPVYNVEQYLEEAIKSICAQTYKNLEIILVNDGSLDNSAKLCDYFATTDKRIKVIHKENGGLSSARNAGLDNATGEYVGFVDSDDYIANDMYEKLLDGFYCMDRNIGIVSGQILKNVNGFISSYARRWEHENYHLIEPHSFAEKMILTESNFTCWSKLYRKELLKNIRFKEGRNNEDSYFIFELSKEVIKKGLYTLEIPHYVYYYRIRENSICTSAKTPLQIDVIKNFTEFRDYYYSIKDFRLARKIDNYVVFVIYKFCHVLYLNETWKEKYYMYYVQYIKTEYLSNILKNNYLSLYNKIRAYQMCFFPKLYGCIYRLANKRLCKNIYKNN